MPLDRRNLRVRTVAVLALTLAALACGPDRRARLWVRFIAADDYAAPNLLSASVSQGGTGRVLDAGSMPEHSGTHGRYDASSGPLYLTAGKEVSVAFYIGGGGGLPTETVTFTPQEDYDYGVDAVIDSIRPRALCAYVGAAHPLPAIGSGPADTLFVMRSGIPRGAVC